MQGNAKVAEDDVREVGKAIGVTFNGDNENMFSVLARAVANVYASCDTVAKQHLWDSLSMRIQALGRSRVCVCGDFNVVRRIEECRSGSGRPQSPDLHSFNHFTEGNNLINLPLSGRNFTWFKGDDLSMSHLDSRIESLQDRLAALDVKGGEEDLSDTEIEELHGVTSDLHSISRLNTNICWQQSRSRWIKEGDANSKYFHSVLANRRLGNAISSLEVGGVTVEGVVPIRKAVVSNFASHFKVVNVVRSGVDSLIFKRLHPTEAGNLTKPFSLKEVKATVWDCDSYKSPGPDGVNFGFIKDFWTEMHSDVMRFIAKFHRNSRLTKGINAAFIALIPKVESPQRLNDFRPISLVGSLYKILAKVLANRLRLVMGSVILESQTAFVRDRQILDGILIANEVVDEARRAKKELILFKVDFDKAYDSVDWATASVLVNGSPTDEFPLERGLRQGDALSPFLFLLAAEGLHFAEDTLLMGTKSWANVRALRVVLVLFDTMSGLKVNFNKSMLVGVNIPDSWLGEAASALGCRVGNIPFLYLGLPIRGDPKRLSFWEPLLTDRVVVPLHAATSLIWHSQVPLKVSLLAWRLLRDWLPTKVNLTYRGIIPVEDSHCVSGCGAVESAQHVFISCSIFGSLWPLISSWVGSSMVTTQTLSDHFVQFTTSTGGTRARRSFMQLIWLACVWVVWTERNHRLFGGSANSSLHMLDKISRLFPLGG
ncbi:hypothetical protein TSUD_213660 [Trifolium subterraneum]|uniref:Reverse transcriptase domain-containing protein n=1 Tax=Trifolium subterraneum TaxID=3900 RepID=A0A2Z6NJP1_TRISU|nr:hypothetical protein TSUD_213660 [Trifolium subterraneum]